MLPRITLKRRRGTGYVFTDEARCERVFTQHTHTHRRVPVLPASEVHAEVILPDNAGRTRRKRERERERENR
jgi:hypothetical protein